MCPLLFYTQAELSLWVSHIEGMFALRAPGVPNIQTNVPVIYDNALPANATSSSSPVALSTSTLYDCWQSHNLQFFIQQTGQSHAPPPLSTPPPCISYTNVRNYYGPYAQCSLDKGVACAKDIQLPTQTCARMVWVHLDLCPHFQV